MKGYGEESEPISKTSSDYRSILVVIRYPSIAIPFAFLSMALFHFPLWFNKQVYFYKLMGCGKNGTFDIRPDLHQWAVMLFYKKDDFLDADRSELEQRLFGRLIRFWWKIFGIKKSWFHLEPIAGHGTWDGKKFINESRIQSRLDEKIGVLTRATIRTKRLSAFWSAVPKASDHFEKNPGFIYSVGIGEIPFIKQATFSIWENEDTMKAFAYRKQNHREVIQRTRDEGWYSEEMFLRFRILEELNFG